MLSIDIGLKRIGLAQYIQGIIIPLPAIFRKNRIQAANDLNILIDKKNINILIIGISNAIMETRAKHFLTLIKFEGEIKFIDEHISSKEAEELIKNNPNRKYMRKNGSLDSIAAMIILERYLNLNK